MIIIGKADNVLSITGRGYRQDLKVPCSVVLTFSDGSMIKADKSTPEWKFEHASDNFCSADVVMIPPESRVEFTGGGDLTLKNIALCALRTIIVARVEEETIIIKEGQIDIGKPHVFVTRPKAGAMCWINLGTDQDMIAAQTWAQKQGYRVFVYPTTEKDPLNRAREDVLK